MDLPALQHDLNAAYGLDLPEAVTMEALEHLLAAKINTLINGDFDRLVQLLYRIDVNEESLRQILKTNAQNNTGNLIARLILERSQEKIRTRKMYSGNRSDKKDQPNADEEERW